MPKGIRLTDLDPGTQRRVIGSLHEQGLIEDLRHQGKNPRQIVDELARAHASKRRKLNGPKLTRKTDNRPWYIWSLRTWMFMLGYSWFGIGWCMEYAGYYFKRLGEEMNKGARRL